MKYKLSICIPTLNRGEFIGETLESIACQLEDSVEIVIVDGGSNDETESIIMEYKKKFPIIKYIRRNQINKPPSNEGFDRDCNYAVEIAQGDYCWLMTDDDLFVPGAIKRILKEIEKNYDLIIANTEVRNKDFSKILTSKRPDLIQDRTLNSTEFNEFASLALFHLTFVGAVIIKRSLWIGIDKEKYYGTGFIHVGVIFDKNKYKNILITSEPLIIIRYGNALWTSRTFQLWMFTWPELVWSFSSISDDVKKIITLREPWKNKYKLLFYRANNNYSILEYNNFLKDKIKSRKEKFLSILIAVIPYKLLYIPLLMKQHLDQFSKK